jgi:hypothetical protein
MISEAAARALAEEWRLEIESISVDGWSRSASASLDLPDWIYPKLRVSMELSPLFRGGEEDEDFSGKRYSRWAFRLSELWKDRIESWGEEYWHSANWTRVWNSWIDSEYRVWSFSVAADADRLAAAERDRRLRQLGL